MRFRRGDIVLVVAPGAFGKARPAVVLQADLFNTDPPSVTVCLVTTHLQTGNPIRIALPANRTTGLERVSHAQADKVLTLPADRIRTRLGTVPPATILEINAALRVWLDL